MKILLVYPKAYYMKPWIPIGIMSIASYLKRGGFNDVSFFDMNSGNIELLKDRLTGVDVVGIGGTTIQYSSMVTTASFIREYSRNILIVFGGPHFIEPDQAVASLEYCDACVVGEGERTFFEICQKKDMKDIPGLVYKNNGVVRASKDRELISDLDDIPIPAYDLVDVDNFSDEMVEGAKCLSIMTGRGCPNDCFFCASPNIWKRKVRNNTIDYVIEHIKFLIAKYQIQNLRIMDDTFSLKEERVLEFCDRIEEEGIKLSMDFLTSARNTNPNVFSRMRSVGFSLVAFGVESGSKELLSKVGKNSTIEDVKTAVDNARKAGLKTQCLFMIGNIGETEKSIQESIELSRTLQGTYSYFQYAVPYPGTRFYREYREHGEVLTNDFDQYNPRKVVFVPKGLTREKMERYMDIAMRRS